MNIDGSEWQAIQRTTTPFDKYTPQLKVVGNELYYVWEESDGKVRQVWTAVVNKDGTGWRSEKRTKSLMENTILSFKSLATGSIYVCMKIMASPSPSG